jgi:hypothetical protein
VRLAGSLAQGDQDDATPLDQPAVIELGSDLPIERLRSGFEPLYRAYDEIFAQHAPRDRELLLRVTGEEWYGAG